MGIPSFYKHLLQTVSGLTHVERQTPPQVFALDLNCAIYHCARNKMTTPYTQEGSLEWEQALLREVQGYILHMTRLVKPTMGVYIAVDGVAPMAKIRQQRTRRFKSALSAAEEADVKAVATGKPVSTDPRWDTNSITPGTAFMVRLGIALRELKLGHSLQTWVSAADEAGEGEQKIMDFLRARRESVKDMVIYGLDADLIVLSLLEHGCSGVHVELYREVTEFGGGVKLNNLGGEQYLYMSIPLLADTLFQTWSPRRSMTRTAFLWDFVGMMSLLGNDFVPHGMALKINDNGIEHVLEALKTLLAKEGQLVVDGTYNSAVLQKLLVTLASQEERWMQQGIRHKLEARVGSTAAKDAEAIAMATLNDRPVQWGAERVLVEFKQFEGQEKPRCVFRPAWRRLYNQHALWSAKPADTAAAYLKTLAWTLAYYAGSPVDLTWYYPWLLPPLFETLAEELYKCPAILTLPPPCPRDAPLKPVEQLAMVLPQTSFHLLPAEYQKLPKLYPHAWPTAWSWFSMGRRFLWQCEPLIPLVQPSQIRHWMEECLDEE